MPVRRGSSKHLRVSVEKALAAALLVHAGSFLAGCSCSDDYTHVTNVAIPPPFCDGKLLAGYEMCPPTTGSEAWALPDGGTTDYHEAKRAWTDLSCAEACAAVGLSMRSCELGSDDGKPRFECAKLVEGSCRLSPPGKGRRPDGFSGSVRECDDLGVFLVAMGELEDASVPAFRRLKTDLARRGAPKRLRRAASRAAREERRHTRAAFAFARRVGRLPSRAAVPAHDANRLIEDLARENAVEGCVHELHGAAVAAWAANHARDPAMRAMMKRVAAEEASHAALGFELMGYYDARLDRAARQRVRRAAGEAVRALCATLTEFPRLAADGVLPSRAAHAVLLDMLRDGPWKRFTGSR